MSTGGAERAAESPFAAPGNEARLLSPWRARRFDLLLHLIANLDHPLAVCGPQGAGKTTFLHLIGEQALENWRVIPLDTGIRLTAQQAQDAILAALDGGSEGARSLETALGELARGGQLTVVVLDDAGRLPPVTLAELHRLARLFPVLRLVLALRPEEARARASTNAGLLDDCHFIEVPPLDEAHCGAFLRHLAHTPPRLLGPAEVTDAWVGRVFRATGGVPGRILGYLSAPPERPRGAGWRAEFIGLGIMGLSFAVALLATLWNWRAGDTPDALPAAGKETAPVAEIPAPEPPAPAAPSPAEVAPPPPLSEPAQPSGSSPTGIADPGPPPSVGESDAPQDPQSLAAGEGSQTASPVPAPALPSGGIEPQQGAEAAVQPAAEPANDTPVKDGKPSEEKKKEEGGSSAKRPAEGGAGKGDARAGLPAGVAGPDWLLAQDAAAWSLQIMSARDPSSIAALQKRYPGLKGLVSYRAVRKGKAMYPVFYGLFASEEEARRAAARLPESLGSAVPKRLGDIQRGMPRSK